MRSPQTDKTQRQTKIRLRYSTEMDIWQARVMCSTQIDKKVDSFLCSTQTDKNNSEASSIPKWQIKITVRCSPQTDKNSHAFPTDRQPTKINQRQSEMLYSSIEMDTSDVFLKNRLQAECFLRSTQTDRNNCIPQWRRKITMRRSHRQIKNCHAFPRTHKTWMTGQRFGNIDWKTLSQNPSEQVIKSAPQVLSYKTFLCVTSNCKL